MISKVGIQLDDVSIPHKYGKYDDASNTTNLVSVCLADGVTKRYSIWIDTIEKCTWIKIRHVIVEWCKGVYIVDRVSQLNFQPPNLHTDISATIFVGGFLRRPKGSGSERHTCNMAQFELGSEAQQSK